MKKNRIIRETFGMLWTDFVDHIILRNTVLNIHIFFKKIKPVYEM